MSIGSSRATKRPAQGGAGSKRCVLGCDPGAGQESARDCACLTRAFTVASPETGAPAPRFGASPVLAATRRHGALSHGLCPLRVHWGKDRTRSRRDRAGAHPVADSPCNLDVVL